ncbi:hypothetical protein CFL01nite_00840 [Corynebacterium flavescens]|uniref:Uncharacterized protein n=1 Tax=Corynebacterium flavescens TaxID=28028 RepID=A0AB73B4T2_CORFL|nr:hypothetical protein CFL01nite_00840 [Corynebacterium flavescens]
MFEKRYPHLNPRVLAAQGKDLGLGWRRKAKWREMKKLTTDARVANVTRVI